MTRPALGTQVPGQEQHTLKANNGNLSLSYASWSRRGCEAELGEEGKERLALGKEE